MTARRSTTPTAAAAASTSSPAARTPASSASAAASSTSRRGIPDGLALDADGCLWLAVFGTGEVRRYTPAGDLDTVIPLPVDQPTSMAFGGDDLSTLYITTAREDLTPAEVAAQPHSGDIFACTPGVAGRPPNRFAA